MDANFIALLSSNIDDLGKGFTAATYGVLAAYLTPVLSGLLVLYLVFWGFQFWQGRGDTNIMTAAFKMLRLAVIFFIATSWGPFQVAVYEIVTFAPVFISNNIMLNNIINPDNGKAMTVGTVATDISTIYAIALKASIKIEQGALPPVAAPPAPASPDKPAPPAPPAPRPKPPANPMDTVLTTPLQAAIVWISAALFVGYAIFLMLFAKIALWVMLALAPIFIIMLMFRMPSRFFSGWLTATIQVMLVPIFLSTFLSFYILGVRASVMALYKAVASNEIPVMMKDVAPFVLICLAGIFLLAQIVPLAGRIASSSQEWAGGASGQEGAIRSLVNSVTGRSTRSSSRFVSSAGGQPAGGQYGGSSSSDTNLRDIQDRNAAVTRQTRNR